MAAGVTLLTFGLLSYTPSAFGDRQTSEPSIAGGDPLFSARPSVVVPTATPLEIGPSATPARPQASPARPQASQTPAPSSRGVASRIRIPSLQIDLPVIPGDLVVPGNHDLYPLCDVAMYMPEFMQPGERGTTYIYAHAQRGMFLPLLRASQVDDGSSLIGGLIEVYTTRNELHLYEIVQVKRHATDLSLATTPGNVEQLVLQTSEGPSGTVPKLQIAARPVSVVPSTGAESAPDPHPRVCLPG